MCCGVCKPALPHKHVCTYTHHIHRHIYKKTKKEKKIELEHKLQKGKKDIYETHLVTESHLEDMRNNKRSTNSETGRQKARTVILFKSGPTF